MKFSQMNLRSGIMERTQRKLDEENETNDNICPLKIKVNQRQRVKQNKGWMLR